jgi:hypothetical protein
VPKYNKYLIITSTRKARQLLQSRTHSRRHQTASLIEGARTPPRHFLNIQPRPTKTHQLSTANLVYKHPTFLPFLPSPQPTGSFLNFLRVQSYTNFTSFYKFTEIQFSRLSFISTRQRPPQSFSRPPSSRLKASCGLSLFKNTFYRLVIASRYSPIPLPNPYTCPSRS